VAAAPHDVEFLGVMTKYIRYNNAADPTTNAMKLNLFINWKHQQLITTQKRSKIFIMFSAAAGKREMSPDSGKEDHKTADGGETYNAIPRKELDNGTSAPCSSLPQ
jgi:hypothetical protein